MASRTVAHGSPARTRSRCAGTGPPTSRPVWSSARSWSCQAGASDATGHDVPHVGLHPDLRGVVHDPRRHGRLEPQPQRVQRAGDQLGRRRVDAGVVRPAHDQRGLVRPTERDGRARLPAGERPHERHPVAGVARGDQELDRGTGVEQQLVGQQVAGLGDPVGERRARQLRTHARVHVVVGDQRCRAGGPDPAGEELGDQRHARSVPRRHQPGNPIVRGQGLRDVSFPLAFCPCATC